MTSTFLRLRGIWNIAWNRSVQPLDKNDLIPNFSDFLTTEGIVINVL